MMTGQRTRATFLVTGLLAAFVSRDARALGPVDVEVGAKGGVGTNVTDGPPDLLGFGLGGRGGVSVLGLYAGVDIMRYFGSTTAVLPYLKDSASAWMGGVDLGYIFKIALVTIRPQLGTGDIFISSTVSRSPCLECLGQPQVTIQTQTSSSGHNLYFEPGVTALVPIGTFFVGLDANLFVLPHIVDESGDKPQTAFTAHGQVGLHF